MTIETVIAACCVTAMVPLAVLGIAGHTLGAMRGLERQREHELEVERIRASQGDPR